MRWLGVAVALTVLSFIGSVFAQQNGTGIAFAFSGAGGRIAQQLALMESLVMGLSPSGVRIRPQYIAGASAGAINAVALNAILRTMDTNDPNGLTFDVYKQMIFGMNSSEIYDDTWSGMAKVFTHNIPAGYILDNTPMEQWMAAKLKSFNFNKFGDLYLPTEITLVNQSSGLDVRLWSTDAVHGQLDLLEVLLATAAMPIAFPTRTVSGFPGTTFIDGGTGIDMIPVVPLVDNPNITEVYMLCYNSALTSGGGTLPKNLNHVMLLKNVLAAIEDQQVDYVAGAVDIAAKSETKSYTYFPVFPQVFSPLSFDEEKLQYDLTAAWARQNDPTPVN